MLQGFNHPEPHAAFLAEAAFVGYLHQFFGQVYLEMIAVAADAGLIGSAGFDADEGGFRLVEQLQVAIGGATERLSVDDVVTGKESSEYAQLIARVCR